MKTSKIFLMLALLCFSPFSTANTVDYDTQWAKSIVSGSAESSFRSVAVDSDNNIYTSGHIDGTNFFNFGNGVSIRGNYTSNNALLTKYNSGGETQWAKSVITGLNSSRFNCITVDASGNIYAVGYINGTNAFDFGNGVSVSSSYTGKNIVIVKYNSNGEAQWAKSVISSTDSSSFYTVRVDDSGDIYTVGYIEGTNTFNFGNSVQVSGAYTNSNFVIVKYNSNGYAQWAKSVSTAPNESRFYTVITDKSNNLYAAGYIEGTGTYDVGNGITVSGSDSGRNIILIKYNSSGGAQWAKSVSSSSDTSQFNSLAVDSNDNIYAVGYINGTGAFDFGNSITVNGTDSGSNLILVKYNNDGQAQWAKSTVSSSCSTGYYSLFLDSSDNIYTSGSTNQNCTIDLGNSITTTSLTDAGYNGFIARYNSDGEPEWTKTATSASSEFDYSSIAPDNNENICIAMYLSGNGNFDFGNNVIASGSYNGNNAGILKYEKIIPANTSPASKTTTKLSTILGIGAAIAAAI